MNTTLEILTADETDALAVCEQRIAAGIESFRDVGLALKHIRDGKLYRATHASFEAYCREKWNFSKSRGNQIILATVTVELLPEGLATIVANEGAARELARVEPEHREEVVRRAADAGPVTAKAIKEAAAEVAPEADEPQLVEPQDGETRARMITLHNGEDIQRNKDFLASINPTRKELIQTALQFIAYGRQLERAAAELPED